jgi:hypothetical protein
MCPGVIPQVLLVVLVPRMPDTDLMNGDVGCDGNVTAQRGMDHEQELAVRNTS